MASILIVLLSVALVCTTIAAPIEAPSDATTRTVGNIDNENVGLVEYVRVVDLIPVVVVNANETTEDVTDKPVTEDNHKVVKRSALRGDNPSNDLLANLDGLNYENGLSNFAGRRIKFLPTWLG